MTALGAGDAHCIAGEPESHAKTYLAAPTTTIVVVLVNRCRGWGQTGGPQAVGSGRASPGGCTQCPHVAVHSPAAGELWRSECNHCSAACRAAILRLTRYVSSTPRYL